eukprot:6407168-Alexandrium_andersonii.AAC.1
MQWLLNLAATLAQPVSTCIAPGSFEVRSVRSGGCAALPRLARLRRPDPCVVLPCIALAVLRFCAQQAAQSHNLRSKT